MASSAAHRTRVLAGALIMAGATALTTTTTASAAVSTAARGPAVLHSTTYRYAYGYTLYLRIVRDRSGSQVYADCTVQGTGPDKRVGSCQLLRSTGGGGGTARGNGWNSVAAVAYSRMIPLRCGVAYRVFIRFKTWGGPWAKAYGTWYGPRCR